ncbi:MAG: hypothetical protein IJ574_02630 [Bacilli bacterium]|nr:hypothetical protein [Bacilli bacterium]
MDSRELIQETIKKNNYFYEVMDAVRNNEELIENDYYKDTLEQAQRIANNQLRIYNGIMENIDILKVNGVSDSVIKNYEKLADLILEVFKSSGYDSYKHIKESMNYSGKEVPIAYFKNNIDMSILIKNAIDKTDYKNNIDALVNGENLKNSEEKEQDNENSVNEELNEYFRQAIVEGYWLNRYENNIIDDDEYEVRQSSSFDKESNKEIADLGIKIGRSADKNIRTLKEQINNSQSSLEKEQLIYLLATVKEVLNNKNLTIDDIVDVNGYYVNKQNEGKVKDILQNAVKSSNDNITKLSEVVDSLNNVSAKKYFQDLISKYDNANSIDEKKNIIVEFNQSLENHDFYLVSNLEDNLKDALTPLLNLYNNSDNKEIDDEVVTDNEEIAEEDIVEDETNEKDSSMDNSDILDADEEEIEVKEIKSNIKENDSEQEKQRKITMRKLIKYGAIAIIAIGLSQYLIIPSFMQVNSLLWAANPGMQTFFHGLNNVLGTVINASFNPTTGIWTSMTGHSINAMLSTQSIYTSLLSSIAGIGALKVGIDFINKITKGKAVNKVEKVETEIKEDIEEELNNTKEQDIDNEVKKEEINEEVQESEEIVEKDEAEDNIDEVLDDSKEDIEVEEDKIEQKDIESQNVENANEVEDDNKEEINNNSDSEIDEKQKETAKEEFNYQESLKELEEKYILNGYTYMPLLNKVDDNEDYVFDTYLEYDEKTGGYKKYYFKTKPKTMKASTEKKTDLKEKLVKIKEVLGGAATSLKENAVEGFNDIKNAFNNDYSTDDEYEEDKPYGFKDSDVDYVEPEKKQSTNINYDNPIEEMRLISEQIASADYDYGYDAELVKKAKKSIQSNLFTAEVAYSQGNLEKFNKCMDETLDVIDGLFVNIEDKSVRDQYMEALYDAKEKVNEEARTR